MAFQREIEIDKERVTSFLKNALNKVMTEENPDLLNDLKKIFKRTIPFSKRMYVAAYLTKEMQGRFHGAPNARRNDIFMHGVRGGRNFKDASYGRPSYKNLFPMNSAPKRIPRTRACRSTNRLPRRYSSASGGTDACIRAISSASS